MRSVKLTRKVVDAQKREADGGRSDHTAVDAPSIVHLRWSISLGAYGCEDTQSVVANLFVATNALVHPGELSGSGAHRTRKLSARIAKWLL